MGCDGSALHALLHSIQSLQQNRAKSVGSGSISQFSCNLKLFSLIYSPAIDGSGRALILIPYYYCLYSDNRLDSRPGPCLVCCCTTTVRVINWSEQRKEKVEEKGESEKKRKDD